MGYWDYRNIGVSVTPENERFVRAILRYIGYGDKPDYAGDGDHIFYAGVTGVVYVCEESAKPGFGGKFTAPFDSYGELDLLYLMNALFPETNIEVHHAEGNNTSDVWEKHEETYDVETMTYSSCDSYTSIGDYGPNGSRSHKERFALGPPPAEYVNALIERSTADGNTELTALLLELSQKLRDGLIVYEDDGSDKREIGEAYDEEDDVDEDETDDEEDEDGEEEVDDVPEFQAEIITFGHYPQTENGDDMTPIEWFVLKKDGNKALVISRYCLDAMAYHSESGDITWENCSPRAWLNKDFLNTAFTEAEQAAILTTEVDNGPSQGNAAWKTQGGNNTRDQVFLLSWSEAESLFSSDDERRCAVTPFAESRGAYADVEYLSGGRSTGWWWLRSPGDIQSFAADVLAGGSLSSDFVDLVDVCVRPAFWLNLDSDIF